jgi:hypothetical protein
MQRLRMRARQLQVAFDIVVLQRHQHLEQKNDQVSMQTDGDYNPSEDLQVLDSGCCEAYLVDRGEGRRTWYAERLDNLGEGHIHVGECACGCVSRPVQHLTVAVGSKSGH